MGFCRRIEQGALGLTHFELSRLSGLRCFIVASTGGHLSQAVKWADRLSLAPESTFLTFRSPQSESLLSGRPVIYTDYISPRDYSGVLRTAGKLLSLESLAASSAIFSTGAGLALAALPASLLRRKPYVYVESVSRFLGPSFTGRSIARSRLATCFTQHQSWADDRWHYAGTLLSDYRAQSRPPTVRENLRVFVTLGTIAPYRFDHLVDAVLGALRPSDDVVWQLGVTARDGLQGEVAAFMSADEFARHLEWADVVVTHAGVGTLLNLLDRGIRPIVMARRAERGEHVDNHQQQVADYMARLRLIHLVDDAIPRDSIESPGIVLSGGDE